jgi:tetratricopeptide (TPR) repeat protein
VAMRLMEALAATGNRCGAVRHARLHQEAVRAELEVDPDPAVDALADALALAPLGVIPPGPVPTLPRATPVTPIATTPGGLPVRRITTGLAMLAAVSSLAFVASRSAAAPARETVAVEHGPTASADVAARTLYLRAEEQWNRRTREGLGQAVVLFRRAGERDPRYAAAYAGLARAYVLLGYFGFASAEAMFPKAEAAARRALEFDPGAGDAYAALGQTLAWRHEWAAAERAHRRGIELAPDNATVHQWYALMLAYVGRAAEAARHTAEASRLDPLSVQINNMHGAMLYDSGDPAAALAQFERTVNAEPDSAWVRQNPWVVSNYGSVLAATGRVEEGIGLIRRSLEYLPRHPRLLLTLAAAYALDGRADSARAVFERADTAGPQYPVYRAVLDALLGDRDAAFARLDAVREWPLAPLIRLNNSPDLAGFRADPRFRLIRRRLRLPS